MFVSISVLSAIVPAVSIWIINTKIINLIAYEKVGISQSLITFTIIYISLLLLDRIMVPASQIIQGILTDRFTANINLLLMNKANSFSGIRPFEDPSLRDQIQFVQREASFRPMNLLAFWSNMVRHGIIVLSMLALVGTLNPLILILIIATGIPQLISEYKFSKVTMDLSLAQSPDWRKMIYYQQIVTDNEYVKELRIWGIGNFFVQLYKATFKRIHEDLSKIRMSKLYTTAGNSIIGGLGIGIAFAYIIWLASSGKLTIGEVTLYVQAIIVLQSNLIAAAFGSTLFLESMGWMKKLFAILDLQDDSINTTNAQGELSLGFSEKYKISLQSVSFNYPFSSKTILNNISFDIEPGEFVALVGDNGAGKTTLVKLLTRMYDPSKGQIYVNGKNITMFEPEEFRKLFAVVFQDFGKFQLTLRENLALGNLPNIEDFEAIEKAAKKSLVSDFAESLPNKYDSLLGKQFEGGTELSGGQWQRIALGRAFMRDAPIMILDEPTASLDVNAEAEFHRQIRALTKDKTTLVISHRFSTVRMADKIVVLKDGEIVEIGNHSHLMNLNGHYASMYKTQADQYSESAV